MKYFNSVVRLGLMIVFVAGAASFALAQKVHLQGTVTVDGKAARETLSLVAADKEHLSPVNAGRIYRSVEVARDGTFSKDLDIPIGKKFFILPYNEGGLKFESTSFCSGYAEFRAEANPVVQVDLHSTKKRPSYVKAVDEAGKAIPDIIFSLFEKVSLGTQKGSPSWGGQRRTKADPNGIAVLYIVEGKESTHELTLRSGQLKGDRYSGKASITSKSLSQTSIQNPLIVKAKTHRLLVKAKVIWDPSYSKEQFRHDNIEEEAEHTLEIKGPERSFRSEMKSDGTLSLYGLKPGRYVISLSERGRKRFKITGGNVIVVPKWQKAPIESSITIIPAKQYDLRGIVVDKISKEPVTNARISGTGRPIKTGETGEFKMAVVEGAKLLVQHSEYYPEAFAIPSRQPDEPIQLAIQPYPSLSGKVVVGKENAPASFAKLRFRGYPRSFRAQCNKLGEYSVKLIPGKYRLSIKIPVTFEDVKLIRGSRPEVRVYDESLMMEKSDKKLDIKLANIGTGIINISYSKKDLGEKKPLYVCLLTKKDSKIISSVQISEEGSVTIYAAEGKYNILVAASEELGVIAGDIKIEGAKVSKTNVTVEKWRKLRITGNGQIEIK